MLNNLLTKIDLFGVPISIKFSGKAKANSKLGGICSLFYFGIAIWALYTASRDLFSFRNPKTMSSESHNSDPSEMMISAESFPLAFLVIRQDSPSVLNNDSIYTVKMFHSTFETVANQNGVLERKETRINIATEKCTPDHFSTNIALFSQFIQDGAICIARNQSEIDKIRVKGVSESAVQESLTFQILKCDDSLSEIPCAPEEEINKSLSGAWLIVLYSGLVMDLQNYSQPDSRYANYHYQTINSVNYQEIYFELQHVEVANDVGWFSGNIEYQNFVKVNRIVETLRPLSNTGKALIGAVFEASKLKNNYFRTYKKIPEVLAEAGGITGYAFVIIGLIISPYFNLKYKEFLLNELFDFSEPSKQTQLDKNILKDKTALDEKNTKYKLEVKNKNPNSISKKYKISENGEAHNMNIGEKIPIKEETKTITKKNQQHNKTPHQSKVTAFNRSCILETPLSSSEKRKLESEINSSSYSNVFEKESHEKNKWFENNKASKEESINFTNIIAISSSNDNNKKALQPKDESKSENENPKKGLMIKEKVQLKEEEILDTIYQALQKQNLLTSFEKSEKPKDRAKNMNIKLEIKKEIDPMKASLNGKNRIIELSIWEYICSFVYKSRSVKQKFAILKEGIKNIDHRLDVINLIKQLKDIDQLRALLLNENQSILFNNLPKPKIMVTNNFIKKSALCSSKPRRSAYMQTLENEDEFMRAYKFLKEKKSQTEVDKKLWALFNNNDN